jgi:hypothetical protein
MPAHVVAAYVENLTYAPVSRLSLKTITRVALTAIVPAKWALTEPRRPKFPTSRGGVSGFSVSGDAEVGCAAC